MNQNDFKNWLQAYGSAWETKDTKAFSLLFHPDAEYYWTPFEEPKTGRQAIGHAFNQAVSEQREIHFCYKILSVKPEYGIARWWCKFQRLTGIHVQLDGIFMVRSDKNNLCTEFQEWWHRDETNPSD